MKYATIDKYIEGRLRLVKCVKNDSLTDIEIEGNCFLLLILTSGSVTFTVGSEHFTSVAPCFVCFDDKDAPVLIGKSDLECYAIYFHPTFLNVNMTLDRIRDPELSEQLCAHEMFLCRPFLYHSRQIYIPVNYIAMIKSSADELLCQLEEQRDGYWSCRGRSALIEIIVIMERLMDMDLKLSGGARDSNSAWRAAGIQSAVRFIESNYNKDITNAQILEAAGLNKTEFSVLFKDKYGMTASRYLYAFRIEIAKKQVTFTDVPLKDIAKRCGFKTVQHFTRVFKDFTGETPAEFRRRTLAARIAAFEK